MLNKINSKKQGIIFDFDDTLVKTKAGKNIALRRVSAKIYNYLEKKGIDIDFKKLYKEICVVAKKMDSGKKRVLDRNLWWSFVIGKFSREEPPKSFLKELTKNYWETVIRKSGLYKDTLSVLVYLKNKGYKLGLLSDTDGLKKFKSKRIKALNLKKWFKSIVVAGEDTKQIKPDKRPLSLITRKLNLRPEECVFIGNDPDVDIFGAKRLGMSAILIKRQNNKIKTRPDRIIKKLNEVKKIL